MLFLGMLQEGQNQWMGVNDNKAMLNFSDIISEDENPRNILSKISSREQLNQERFNTKAFDDYIHNYEQTEADK